MTASGLAFDWSQRFGLALAPLFEGHDAAPLPGDHHVLLDGGFGTFALSTSTEDLWRHNDPAGWAWSSDIPHHVTVTDDKVAVLRWDAPHEPRVYERGGVERSLDRFYAYLNDDRLRSNRGVVDHLLNYFRRVRSLSHNAGLPDARTTDVYLAALALLIAPQDYRANPAGLGLAEDGPELCARLAAHGLDAAGAEVAAAPGGLSFLRLHPALAIRHAGGQLFQEAHFELLRVSPNLDLFGLIDAPETRVDNRGGTHFTPPALARSIVEQVLAAMPDLASRQTLTVCDPACGSGAFLHEALRALRRSKFNGRLKLVGLDISAAAIAMARFVLRLSLRDWSPDGGVELELTCGDSLGDAGMPVCDVIVMNPPFIAFGAQSAEQRQQLREATDEGAARGDYSMAFVARGLEALSPGGVLGSLFPASLLSLKAAASWRERIASEGDVRMLASIGDFGLFSHAMVQVACAVVRKGRPQTPSTLTAVLTENDAAATGEALRQIRKLNGAAPTAPIIESRWSLFPILSDSLTGRPTWRLPTPATERLLTALSELSLPSVQNLFEVSQGIQTGLNDALLLTQDEWRALPTRDRKAFRIATMTDSIQNGRVIKPYYVFFPHVASGALFADEAAVAEAAPSYFKKVLAPAKDRLASRAAIVRSKRADWWGLMHPRSWAYNDGPRIISKFFSAEGGFVGDYQAEYLAVMGHVWTPKAALAEADDEALPLADILAAYVALFNSSPFAKLLSLYAPHVAGGQFDLSARHVNPMPLPDLRALSLDPAAGRRVSELAMLGKGVDVIDPTWRSRTAQIVAEMYGAPSLAIA
ncbi:MAG: vspIM [Caulobacter sp.]|nr:vspIM [Caulobacter sp.]